MSTDPHVGKVLSMVVDAGLLDRALENVVYLGDRDGIIQQIAAELTDAASGTVADQRQPQERLLQPLFGHWEIEKDLRSVVLLGDECLLEGLLRRIRLPIDELAAHRMLCGQSADCFSSRQGLDRQVLPLPRLHCLGRTKKIDPRLRVNRRSTIMTYHVCFLRKNWVTTHLPVWGKQTLLQFPTRGCDASTNFLLWPQLGPNVLP